MKKVLLLDFGLLNHMGNTQGDAGSIFFFGHSIAV